MTSFSSQERRKKFKALIQKKAVLLPGVFNALCAKLAQQTGFKGIYISGASVTASAGVPDIGLLTMTEMRTAASSIVNAVHIPCICDADTGFGEAVNVARTVEEFERVGLAGLHIEDQVFPKRCGHLSGKELISPAAMRQKIKTAAISKNDPHFLIIARTDARAVEGLPKAIDRAKAYVDAGADIIFPEALQSKQEFETFSKKIKVPLMANMTEFGVSPSFTFSELSELGYKLVIFPVSALRVAMKAVELFLGDLKAEGTQKNWLDSMQTRTELYELINYQAYAALDHNVAHYEKGLKK